MAGYQEGVPVKAAEIIHDGVPIVNGDELTSVWILVKPVDLNKQEYTQIKSQYLLR